jgi:hypothetical protein
VRGCPPHDVFPSVRVGTTSLTPATASIADPDATTVERLSALLRPMNPRANGYLASIARRAYEDAAI